MNVPSKRLINISEGDRVRTATINIPFSIVFAENSNTYPAIKAATQQFPCELQICAHKNHFVYLDDDFVNSHNLMYLFEGKKFFYYTAGKCSRDEIHAYVQQNFPDIKRESYGLSFNDYRHMNINGIVYTVPTSVVIAIQDPNGRHRKVFTLTKD